MSKVILTVTNVSGDELDLGSYFGDELADGSTRELRVNPDEISKNSLQFLDRLKLQGKLKVDVSVPSGSNRDLTSLVEQASAKGVSGDGPTIWVGPDGSDDNPGTRNAPYASIQKAVDDLYGEFGDDEYKTVRLKRGIYTESVILNSSKWQFLGETDSVVGGFGEDRVQWRSDTTKGPALFVTNGTKESAQAFLDDGGPDYTEDTGAGTFTYTGASLQRDIREGLTAVFDAEVLVSDITFYTLENSLPNNSALIVAAPFHASGDSNSRINNLVFEDVSIGANFSGTDGYSVYLKNLLRSSFEGHAESGPMILDNCFFMGYDIPRSSSVTNPAILDGLTVRVDGSISGDEVPNAVDGPDLIWSYFRAPISGNFHYYLQPNEDLHSIYTQWNHSTKDNFRSMGVSGFGAAAQWIPLFSIEGTCFFDADRGANIKRVETSNIVVNSTGTVELDHASVRENVTVNAGTMNINGGTIKGNLVVDGAANINLSNVVVKGDVTINSGAGTVTWSGGSFHGTITDPDAKLGGVAAGSYLNV